MKRIILYLFLLSPILCCAQISTHEILGIDLNQSWTTLTNQSLLGYFNQKKFREENNIPGVAEDLYDKYLLENTNDNFLKIGFTDYVLVFPSDSELNLDVLSPTIFTASKTYKSELDLDKFSEKDFTDVAAILMNQFGPPNKSMKESWGAMFEWNTENAQIILNTNKSEHLNLVYYKKQ